MCHPICYPRSYCTMAFFKGDTSYKLTCPSTAPHAIHCPCHLLRQPLRPFDLYCTPHNNGCATSRWNKNHQNPQWCVVGRTTHSFGVLMVRMVLGIFSSFWMATQEIWSLQLQATALWDNRRTWRHPGVEGPRGSADSNPFRVSKREQHVISCHICYDGTIQIFTKHRAYNRCCLLSLYVRCCLLLCGCWTQGVPVGSLFGDGLGGRKNKTDVDDWWNSWMFQTADSAILPLKLSFGQPT